MPVAPEHQPKYQPRSNSAYSAQVASGPRTEWGMRRIDALQMIAQNRVLAIGYLIHGDAAGEIPTKLKKVLDNLTKASDAGELQATKMILDRVLGGVVQNVQMAVTDRKLIVDDTGRAALPAGSPAARAQAQYKILEAQAAPPSSDSKKTA